MPYKDWREGKDWQVFVRDKYTCRYCGLNIAAFGNRWDLFVDHLKPTQIRGTVAGPDTTMNLVTACMGCNRLKGGFDPTSGGPAPETKEQQERLIHVANGHIKARREQWVSDATEMQREAGLAETDILNLHPKTKIALAKTCWEPMSG
jgi:5-methylcytosine-specific restriction endonuclease McrA